MDQDCIFNTNEDNTCFSFNNQNQNQEEDSKTHQSFIDLNRDILQSSETDEAPGNRIHSKTDPIQMARTSQKKKRRSRRCPTFQSNKKAKNELSEPKTILSGQTHPSKLTGHGQEAADSTKARKPSAPDFFYPESTKTANSRQNMKSGRKPRWKDPQDNREDEIALAEASVKASGSKHSVFLSPEPKRPFINPEKEIKDINCLKMKIREMEDEIQRKLVRMSLITDSYTKYMKTQSYRDDNSSHRCDSMGLPTGRSSRKKGRRSSESRSKKKRRRRNGSSSRGKKRRDSSGKQRRSSRKKRRSSSRKKEYCPGVSMGPGGRLGSSRVDLQGSVFDSRACRAQRNILTENLEKLENLRKRGDSSGKRGSKRKRRYRNSGAGADVPPRHRTSFPIHDFYKDADDGITLSKRLNFDEDCEAGKDVALESTNCAVFGVDGPCCYVSDKIGGYGRGDAEEHQTGFERMNEGLEGPEGGRGCAEQAQDAKNHQVDEFRGSYLSIQTQPKNDDFHQDKLFSSSETQGAPPELPIKPRAAQNSPKSPKSVPQKSEQNSPKEAKKEEIENPEAPVDTKNETNEPQTIKESEVIEKLQRSEILEKVEKLEKQENLAAIKAIKEEPSMPCSSANSPYRSPADVLEVRNYNIEQPQNSTEKPVIVELASMNIKSDKLFDSDDLETSRIFDTNMLENIQAEAFPNTSANTNGNDHISSGEEYLEKADFKKKIDLKLDLTKVVKSDHFEENEHNLEIEEPKETSMIRSNSPNSPLEPQNPLSGREFEETNRSLNYPQKDNFSVISNRSNHFMKNLGVLGFDSTSTWAGQTQHQLGYLSNRARFSTTTATTPAHQAPPTDPTITPNSSRSKHYSTFDSGRAMCFTSREERTQPKMSPEILLTSQGSITHRQGNLTARNYLTQGHDSFINHNPIWSSESDGVSPLSYRLHCHRRKEEKRRFRKIMESMSKGSMTSRSDRGNFRDKYVKLSEMSLKECHELKENGFDFSNISQEKKVNDKLLKVSKDCLKICHDLRRKVKRTRKEMDAGRGGRGANGVRGGYFRKKGAAKKISSLRY